MDWLQVSVFTSNEGIDPLCGVLMDLGITGFEIEDEADFKSFLEENKQYWDYVDDDLLAQKSAETRVKIYVSDNDAGRKQLEAINDSIHKLRERDTGRRFGRLVLTLDTLNEEDWAENWKQFFHPLKIGRKVLIQPEWEPCDNPGDRVVFTINPGMSFGTGSHHTTQLCIEAIEKYIRPGQNILDLGCGSGILFIIALLLGAKHAVAVDIDPNAVQIARENALKNRFSSDRYTAYSGNILTDTELQGKIAGSGYEIVVANIVADVIIPLSEIIPRFLDKDGLFIASGVIIDHLDEVKSAIKQHFKIIDIKEKSGWAAIYAKLD